MFVKTTLIDIIRLVWQIMKTRDTYTIGRLLQRALDKDYRLLEYISNEDLIAALKKFNKFRL